MAITKLALLMWRCDSQFFYNLTGHLEQFVKWLPYMMSKRGMTLLPHIWQSYAPSKNPKIC